MSCTNTTAMYLNVSTDICASASASRSGNTITVSGTFSVRQGNQWNWNAIYAYVDGQTSWTKVKPYKTDGGGYWEAGFSFSFNDANAGTRSYNAIFQVWNNAESGTVGNSASVGFSVSYDAATSPPTGLSCSNITRGQESFTANVSISGWGVGSGSRYRELQCWTYNSSSLVEPRRWQPQYGDSLSGNITVNNNSNTSSTPLTITPNTMYTLGVYATNGTVSTGSVRVGDYTTLPPTPTISNIDVTSTTATFTYSCPNQGGKYNMTLKYQLNGGSNVTVTTLSGSGTKAGTFTISNLSPGTTNTVTAALSTSAGEVVSNTVTFTTEALQPKLYGPVPATGGYVGRVNYSTNLVSFDNATFLSKVQTEHSEWLTGLSSVRVTFPSTSNQYIVQVYYSGGSYTGNWSQSTCASYGLNMKVTSAATSGYTQISFFTTMAKQITKLYGPLTTTTYSSTLSNITGAGANFGCNDTAPLTQAIIDAGLDPTQITKLKVTYVDYMHAGGIH